MFFAGTCLCDGCADVGAKMLCVGRNWQSGHSGIGLLAIVAPYFGVHIWTHVHARLVVVGGLTVRALVQQGLCSRGEQEGARGVCPHASTLDPSIPQISLRVPLFHPPHPSYVSISFFLRVQLLLSACRLNWIIIHTTLLNILFSTRSCRLLHNSSPSLFLWSSLWSFPLIPINLHMYIAELPKFSQLKLRNP